MPGRCNTECLTPTQEEETHRFGVFVNNYAKILKWNSENRGSTQALNKFADLTGEEWKAIYASGRPSDGDKLCPSANNCPTLPEVNYTSINWVQKGAVTAVKDQGQCGSCWAFSTTGSLEGLYYVNRSILLSFSEQQMLDCDSQCQACNGCFTYLAMTYTAKNGIESDKIYPYKATKGTCKYNQNLALKVNTGYQCVTQKSVPQLLSALSYNPVSVDVEADQSAWQFYSKGIVSSGCGYKLDHSVLLTGYDNINGTNVFIVKNSWGTSWGQQGYIYLSADPSINNGYGTCGILGCPTLAVNKPSQ